MLWVNGCILYYAGWLLFLYHQKRYYEAVFNRYSVYREKFQAKLRYAIWLVAQIILSALSLWLNFKTYPILPQIISLMTFSVYFTIHNLIGYGKIEEALNSGQPEFSKNDIEKYLKLNIPLHRIYVLLYLFYAIYLISQL